MDRKHMTSKGKGFLKGQKPINKNDKYKKFIGNRSEGQGFADKRKRKIQYEYMKMLKKEKLKERLKQAIDKHELELGSGPGASNKSRDHSKSIDKKEERKTVSEHLQSEQSSSWVTPEGSQTKPGFRKKISDRCQKEGSNFKAEFKTEKHSHMNRKGNKRGKEVINRFSKAAEEHKQKKEKKIHKQQDYSDNKKKRDEAMTAYKQRKQETFKKICKKTHKGQPVMKNQIEYLLQKIEKQVNQR